MSDSNYIKAVLFSLLIGGLIASAVPDLVGEASNSVGWLVLGLLVINLLYVLFKQARDIFPAWIQRKDAFRIHRWTGIAVSPIAVAHLVTLRESSPILWLSVGLIIFASMTGYLLDTDYIASTYKRTLYRIHAQHPLVLAITGSLITGHLLVL